MIDSALYWMDEYNINGFRFDLMGLHDIETMNAIRQALDDIDPRLMMYGEGWDMETGLLSEQKAKKKTMLIKCQILDFFNFSIECLPGRMLETNLLNLGILDIVKEAFAELNIDFDAVKNAEHDMALGNGGLGRLAAAFMDSLATTGYPGFGNGLRYKFGLFK